MLIPAIKLIPAFLDWRQHSSILQLYEEVDRLQLQVKNDPQTYNGAMTKLNGIELSLQDMDLGASKDIDVYNLKSHLDLARTRLNEIAARLETASAV